MRVPKLKQPEKSTAPAWVLIQSICGEEERVQRSKKLAYDIVLPLPRKFLHGGRSAARSIGLQVLQALSPYRRAGAPPLAPDKCFELMRCNREGESPWLFIRKFFATDALPMPINMLLHARRRAG